MKTKAIVFSAYIVLFCCICLLEFSVYKLSIQKNKNESKEILKIAHELVDEKQKAKPSQVSNENQQIIEKHENDVVGILSIEKLNIEAPIKEGTTQAIMKTSVGHFTESDFWNGNVSLASHNGGTNMHYFQDIHTLQINDEIKYKTELGEKIYKVQSVEKISDTDWSKVIGNSEKKTNTITLITCINGQPDYRLCVRGIEI